MRNFWNDLNPLAADDDDEDGEESKYNGNLLYYSKVKGKV